MRLLRQLVLICISRNIQIKSVNIPGYYNSIADSISRFQWAKFRTLAPNADIQPLRPHVDAILSAAIAKNTLIHISAVSSHLAHFVINFPYSYFGHHQSTS